MTAPEENGSAITEQKVKNSSSSSLSSLDQAFKRNAKQEEDWNARLKKGLTKIFDKLVGDDVLVDSDDELSKFLTKGTETLAARWRTRDGDSEIAFKGLLLVLEYCLADVMLHHETFEQFVSVLGFQTVAFWRRAVPFVYDSDFANGTKYRDALIFSLALYDVNSGQNRLRELYAAVPGVRQSLLGIHAKRFGEKFHHMQRERTRAASRRSSNSSLRGSMEELNVTEVENDAVADDCLPSSGDHLGDNLCSSGGLADTTHFQQRVINVSNAPPVSLTRVDNGQWKIKQGSGGLVTCVDPVMCKDQENVWLANIGLNVHHDEDAAVNRDSPSRELQNLPTTNSIGLPLIRQAGAGDIFHVLEEDEHKPDQTASQRDLQRDMSLLNVLHGYNKSNYQLNPVIVSQEDYDTYYGGISNGLLWPAFHNLGEYILKDYDDSAVLREHWNAYVRVNYQFSINAVRNSRPQDFIWIHDYHLMLTGQIIRSLDNNLEVGFFLHIPFQPPENWFYTHRVVAEPILRGILRFTKVGFQTHRDRDKYLELVKKHISRVRVKFDAKIDIFTVTHAGWTCSLGVFPVSIKNEDFLQIVRDPKTSVLAHEIRDKIMSACRDKGGSMFFAVERFDYTKGIKEKLLAWRLYLEQHPERVGLDVLLQVAVTNRRSVESYRQYQDDCIAIAEKINEDIVCPDAPDWRPVIFQTDGLPRPQLVAHYLAMDVGVVTPLKDGMNLVAKEMLLCNPKATLMLSTGAGTEVQFGEAGFYEKGGTQYYVRVDNLSDTEAFAAAYYKAATETKETRLEHGSRLNKFILAHDIEMWSTAFLDPSWTHEVIRATELHTLDDFYHLMQRTCKVRRQIVERILKGIPTRAYFAVSLENAKSSLESSCEPGTRTIVLHPTNPDDNEVDSKLRAKFDINDELTELERDLAFLQFIQSDDIQNVEQFVDTLSNFHPAGSDAFTSEVGKAFSLLSEGDHFHYFFTDRDGTLKSYSCSYPASIQPAYSAVIQAQFARRCAQFCAILTTAPLMHIGILDVNTMPEGYYSFGASGGREWYIGPSNQFKDDSISEADLALLDKVYEKVEDMLDTPTFKHFTWIGSGLQKHYGHITIARQDINHSVSSARSAQLYETVCHIVAEIDPTGSKLTVREGEMDLKIFVKAKLSGRIFNKGHGIRILQRQMALKMTEGNILVCGDSETDLPMLEECLACSPQRVYTIWVTANEQLQEKVAKLCGQYGNNHYVCVSCPEVLLGAMAQATIREIKIRPVYSDDDDDL